VTLVKTGNWKISSKCESNGCLAVDVGYRGAGNTGATPVRRSDGGMDFMLDGVAVVSFTPQEMVAFEAGVRAGEFRV
jgi:hypothetical protein